MLLQYHSQKERPEMGLVVRNIQELYGTSALLKKYDTHQVKVHQNLAKYPGVHAVYYSFQTEQTLSPVHLRHERACQEQRVCKVKRSYSSQ